MKTVVVAGRRVSAPGIVIATVVMVLSLGGGIAYAQTGGTSPGDLDLGLPEEPEPNQPAAGDEGATDDEADRDRDSSDGGARAAEYTAHRHKFPVRGPHDYWDGYGAGRGHRGQDVGASCGTRLEAARGGRVQTKAFQGGGAGHYIVIDGKDTGRDYVYMHMRRRMRVHQGERVGTGEKIGEVGQTGNASGCHLHFELWSSPGWFEGGDPMRSVTKKLKRWDSWS